MTLLLDTGEPAKVGDGVWRVSVGTSQVVQSVVQPHWLTTLSEYLTGRLFATEAAACALARIECKQRLAKARKESKREARAIARLEERMRGAAS